MPPQVLGGAEQLLSGVLADDAVRAAYLARTGQPAGGLAAAAGPAKQKALDADACPICFDELTVRVRAWRSVAPHAIVGARRKREDSPCVVPGKGMILAEK